MSVQENPEEPIGPPNYGRRKRRAVDIFSADIPKILKYVGKGPVASYVITYYDGNGEQIPEMDAVPYYARVIEKLAYEQHAVTPYWLVATAATEEVQRPEKRTRQARYFDVRGFSAALMDGRNVLIFDEHPGLTHTDYSTVRRLTRFLDERPDLDISDFRFVSTNPFLMSTRDEIYKRQLGNRLTENDEPPIEFRDLPKATRQRVLEFTRESGLLRKRKIDQRSNGRRRVSVVETPGANLEAVGVALSCLEKGYTVSYEAKSEETVAETHVRFQATGYDLVVVGPPGEGVEKLRRSRRDSMGEFYHFQTSIPEDGGDV